MLDLILVSGAAILPSPNQIIGKIDVAWRVEVVAGHELGSQSPQTRVRNLVPGVACEQERVEPDTPVRGRYALGSFLPPGGDHTIDRARVEVWAVAENDDRSFDLVAERRETAPERSTRPELPVRAEDGACRGLDVVGAEHDDRVVDRSAAAHPFQDRLE
jgi:hypothetical protein